MPLNFREKPRPLSPLEDEIVAQLKKFALQIWEKGATTEDWTVGFKRALRRLGTKRKWKTWASGIAGEADDGEWLLDLVWVAYRGDPLLMEPLGLACEIEWGGPAAVAEDFRKLCVIRAQQLLLIYSTVKGIGPNTLQLCRTLHDMHEVEDNCLLIGVPGSPDEEWDINVL